MLELYQAEWCPHSRKVRQRLTELGLDFTARQVAAEQEDRPDEMEIPLLVTERHERITGEECILEWLDRHYDDREDADAHRRKAAELVQG